jgi:hypothetical protein
MNPEQEALDRADRDVRDLPAADAAARAISMPLVETEAAFIRDALVLHWSARSIAGAGPIADSTLKAVLGLARAQEELLWDGWQALLEGRYLAALHPIRMLDELPHFIQAVSLSPEIAEKLLDDTPDHPQKWEIDKVHAALKADPARAAWLPAESEKWEQVQRAARQDAHRFAHTGGPAVWMGLRLRDGGVQIPRGPDYDEALLRRIATYYAGLAVEAVRAIEFALKEFLAPDGAWAQRQRIFAERWEAYATSRHPG